MSRTAERMKTPMPSPIREARTRAGLSVSEAARRAGVSQPTLTNIELGKRAPSVQVLHAIASVVGMEELVACLDPFVQGAA